MKTKTCTRHYARREWMRRSDPVFSWLKVHDYGKVINTTDCILLGLITILSVVLLSASILFFEQTGLMVSYPILFVLETLFVSVLTMFAVNPHEYPLPLLFWPAVDIMIIALTGIFVALDLCGYDALLKLIIY